MEQPVTETVADLGRRHLLHTLESALLPLVEEYGDAVRKGSSAKADALRRELTAGLRDLLESEERLEGIGGVKAAGLRTVLAVNGLSVAVEPGGGHAVVCEGDDPVRSRRRMRMTLDGRPFGGGWAPKASVLANASSLVRTHAAEIRRALS